jgi:hypothetical protein
MSAKHANLTLAAALFLALQTASAGTAADAGIERMALCQDSWLDWQKAADPRLAALAAHLHAAYTQKEGDPYVTPKAPTTVFGFRVLQLYPGSVGMGVGLSVLVDAPFDKARAGVEHALGKPLKHCDASDGMKTCELEIADKRTLTLMTQDDPKTKSTLLGCYYYYEK